jgi:hypothetical protein
MSDDDYDNLLTTTELAEFQTVSGHTLPEKKSAVELWV